MKQCKPTMRKSLSFPRFHKTDLVMIDKTPKIFNYIRLMQEHTPCIGGSWIEGPIDLFPQYIPDVRWGKVEVNAEGLEKERIEKMIKRVVAKVDEPQLSDDLSYCRTWEEALKEQKERTQLITAYRDYIETCNSLRLLYNLLTPEVNDYLTKRKLIAGTGYSVCGYDKLTDYYQDVAKCKNLIKGGCEKIIISVEDGTIVNVQLVGRKGKDVYDIPLLDKRTDVRCRSNMHDDFMCIIADEPLPHQNISLELLNLFVDPKDVWVDVKNMSFHYDPDSDYLYTFEEVLNNVREYIQSISKFEIREKNKFTQGICKRLECLYRYLRDVVKLDKTESWAFICDLWKLPSSKDDDVRMVIMRYLGLYKKELPIQFIYKQ